jgi:hypothetical protein
VVSAENQVNTYDSGVQSQPEVVTFDDGSYMVAYKSTGITGDGNTYLAAQKYAADGNKTGAELVLGDTETVNKKKDFNLAVLEDGTV